MKKNYCFFLFCILTIPGFTQVDVLPSDGNRFYNFIGNKPWIAAQFFGSKGTFFVDVNGDGKADIVAVGDAGVNVRLSNGNTFFNYLGNKPWIPEPFYGTRGTFFADVNGDSKADAIAVNDDRVTVRLSDGNRFLPNAAFTNEPYYGSRGTYFADVNADGKADAIVVNNDKVTVRLSDGTRFLPNMSFTNEPYYGTRGTFFADVNGDGKADAIVVNDDRVTVRLSDGSRFLPNMSFTNEPYYGSRGTYFADVNGDGKADAIVVNNDKVTVRISTGNNFLPNASWTANGFYGAIGTWFADVNGDGKADAVAVSNKVLLEVNFPTDLDQDGINDAIENLLLEKYRPYYKFSLQGELDLPKSAINTGFSEKYRPADALWFTSMSELLKSHDEDDDGFIKNNELRNNPSLVLFDQTNPRFASETPTSILSLKQLTDYSINPLQTVDGIDKEDPGRQGADWAEVMSKKNVGLYGHVVPLKLTKDGFNALKFDKSHVLSSDDQGEEYYKIEYWQFFGYNNCYCTPDHNHEGDWITVQLIYNPRGDSIETVLFYEHGTKEIRYNMSRTVGTVNSINSKNGEDVKEYRGVYYDSYENGENIHSDDILDKAVRFFKDPSTGEYTHPVVYIENGSHEPWPVSDYRYVGVPNHDGDDYDHTFLTATPPNLGEVEHPIHDAPGADIILQFNGNWGAQNGGARGPSMHYQWTWPASSSIRWVIPQLTN